MPNTKSFKIVERHVIESMKHIAFDEMDWKTIDEISEGTSEILEGCQAFKEFRALVDEKSAEGSENKSDELGKEFDQISDRLVNA